MGARWTNGAPKRLAKLVAADLDGIALEFPEWQDPLLLDFDPPRPIDPEEATGHRDAALGSVGEHIGVALDERGIDPRPASKAISDECRAAWYAKFNPALNEKYGGQFRDNDPETEYPWNDPIMAAKGEGLWLSTWSARPAASISAIRPGDVVFMQRSVPQTPEGVLVERGADARPRIVGATWVGSTHRYWDQDKRRDSTDVITVPLAKFAKPVDVRTLRTRRKGTPLESPDAFADRQRRTLIPLTPAEADLMVDACTLPRDVLSNPDVIAVAARLGGVAPGMRPADAKYLESALARDRVRRAHEQRAVQAVIRFLEARGWSIHDLQGVPNAGADLEIWHPNLPRTSGLFGNRVLVEVKGYGGKALRTVRLQRSQYDRACQAASYATDSWRLVVVLDVESRAPEVQVWTATDVRDRWPSSQVK